MLTFLGQSLLNKLKVAILKGKELQDALEELEEGLKFSKSEELTKWRSQVEEWEEDYTRVNPYKGQDSSEWRSILYVPTTNVARISNVHGCSSTWAC